ncbi:Hsp20/alpha crystallin family protein [Desulfovibrio mangrovi]|uniref:Hsp20/alpha crystallin family protein n=1 Tax=Desulfovibrio mangrovi TaxID=2976983 RepID=UPI002246E712|nr:Hsp20/alpha crystallin family protein [Desulfovibrio mangrovi]UZP67334.1 Hsp20/alpha crystallin family protein [Desulfovibrio mangrovi]
MVIDFSSFYDFPREVERFFDDVARFRRVGTGGATYPLLNIAEDEENYYVEILAPGVDPKEVELTLTERSLVIKCVRNAAEGRYLRQECPAGTFQRVVSLNVPVERDKVMASGADGILKVVLPKAEGVKPRKISITAADSKAIDV